MGRLENQVAVITGGSRGIGRAGICVLRQFGFRLCLGAIAGSRSPVTPDIAYFFTLTRQILPAPSSATNNEPSVHTATPTGRP
jgi:NAD(P)-dependent dehydrogenase (short-subunit alcohol dehydrogenase family)